VLRRPGRVCTGDHLPVEDVLDEEGITDLGVDGDGGSDAELQADLCVDSPVPAQQPATREAQ
jgi:hypothetical protein